jgi:hypothetical protein
VSQNKEGLVSLPGYFTLQLGAAGLAAWLRDSLLRVHNDVAARCAVGFDCCVTCHMMER